MNSNNFDCGKIGISFLGQALRTGMSYFGCQERGMNGAILMVEIKTFDTVPHSTLPI